MTKTSIRLYTDEEVEMDSEGFKIIPDLTSWTDSIPAAVRDMTSKERASAIQLGYDVTRIFEIMADNYNGAYFLKDDSDGSIYTIENARRVDGNKIAILECKRENPKSGGWW